MKGTYLSILIFLALLVSIMAPPAPKITKLRITGCSCTSCSFEQIGYGSVYVSFQGSRVRCRQYPILNGRIVIGWNKICPISSGSGKFVVRAGRYCGVNYDHVFLDKCNGFKCSGGSV